MSILNEAAREAAQSAVGNVKILHGKVREHLSMSEMDAVVEAAIIAALPHLGDPFAWRADVVHGQAFTGSKTMAEEWAKNAAVTPLCLATPAPAVKVKPLEWKQTTHGSLRAGAYRRIYEIPTDDPNIQDKKAEAQSDHDRRVRALLVDQPAPAIPEGWKVVPTVATTEMLIAGSIRERQWSKTLAAAPEPPASNSQGSLDSFRATGPVKAADKITAGLEDAAQGNFAAVHNFHDDPIKAQLVEALRALLSCSMISDVDDFDKLDEDIAAEKDARAALAAAEGASHG